MKAPSRIERAENVSVTYRGSRIVVTGKSFQITLSISTSELTSIYWGATGNAFALVSVDPKPPGISVSSDKLAEVSTWTKFTQSAWLRRPIVFLKSLFNSTDTRK